MAPTLRASQGRRINADKQRKLVVGIAPQSCARTYGHASTSVFLHTPRDDLGKLTTNAGKVVVVRSATA